MLTVFDKELLANELKTFRRENGLHQNELAEKLGLNRSTVSFSKIKTVAINRGFEQDM